MTAKFKDPIYQDETKAREHLEALRWPDGAYCPRCGGFEVVKLGGKAGEMGQYNCRDCRKKFTVTVGTVFERSHIPLTTWLMGFHLMTSSKKGMSAHQLHRMLGITYKTAWFMAHRIREAMRVDTPTPPFGSDGGMVEADETFIGKDGNQPSSKTKGKRRGVGDKNKVLSLVDRDTGRVRSFVIKDLRLSTIAPILLENIAYEACLMTDEAGVYRSVAGEFRLHKSVNHSQEEYVSKFHPQWHTNTIEGFYSIFKRGMRGVYQHCSSQHLHRYMAEFDFRYSNRIKTGCDDKERADRILDGVTGKRLTYQTTRCAGPAFHWKEGRAW